MFKDVRVRYALRCALVGVAALIASLQAGNNVRDAVFAGLAASLAYAGLGAALPAVEPSIGKKQ